MCPMKAPFAFITSGPALTRDLLWRNFRCKFSATRLQLTMQASSVKRRDLSCREAAQFNEGAPANWHPPRGSAERPDRFFIGFAVHARCRSLSLLVRCRRHFRPAGMLLLPANHAN